MDKHIHGYVIQSSFDGIGRQKMVPVVPLLSTQHEQGNTGSFLNSKIPYLRALWKIDLNVKFKCPSLNIVDKPYGMMLCMYRISLSIYVVFGKYHCIAILISMQASRKAWLNYMVMRICLWKLSPESTIAQSLHDPLACTYPIRETWPIGADIHASPINV